MIALAAAMGIGRFVYTPILPFMLDDLGFNQSTMGLIASSNFAGYLFGAILASKSEIPGNVKSWLIASLVASSITTAAMALLSSATGIILLRFLAGMSSAFVMVFASTAVLNQLSVIGRSDLSAYHFAGVGLGITLSAVVVWLQSQMGPQWRLMWFFSGLLSILAVFVVAKLIGPSGHSKSQVNHKHYRRDPALIKLILAYGLFGFGYVITATYIVSIVRDNYQSLNLEFLIWVCVGLSAMVSVGIWSWVGNKIGILRAFSLACGIEAIGVLASVADLGLAGLILAAIILGGTFMGITALGLIGARELSLSNPRQILAWMTASFGLGQIIGPTFAGMLYDLTGNFNISSITAAVALLIAALLIVKQKNIKE